MITIKDIARKLGVSPSTVSRALKDHPDISTATKKAVLELAESLSYHPNQVAQNLRTKKTHTIGIIIPEIIHHFFSTAISGVEDVAYDAGFNVMICQSDESFEREVIDLNAMLSKRVDGIIISVAKNTKDFSHLHKVVNNGVPLVFFDRMIDEITAHKVICDDFSGAYDAVTHFIKNGYRKIAHLKGPDSLLITSNRLNGYKRALEDHKISIDPDLIIEADNLEKGEEAARDMIRRNLIPDAVFGVNDMAAIGALSVFRKNGYRIPDDIGFIGFADEPLASLIDPPLSSVYQPGYEMGQLAVRLCIEQINSESTYFAPVTEMLKTELIARESSLRKVTI